MDVEYGTDALNQIEMRHTVVNPGGTAGVPP